MAADHPILGTMRPPVLALLGPTNTGKTYLAIERMLEHRTGMIGFPLRLLARENYDRVVQLRGADSVALITGEERIVPRRPSYYVCTVEAMPLDRRVEFLAVDEIQLAADRERGHVFTDRLLYGRGTVQTMVLGAETIRPLLKELIPDVEVTTRPRLSTLRYAEPKKLGRLPRRTALIVFSVADLYALAERIRHESGGAALVFGALSPRARNAQVGLYQGGDVDFLVATDAIGMGLNLDIDHVAFTGLTKFDGQGPRHLRPAEVAQIAGRAGRHVKTARSARRASWGRSRSLSWRPSSTTASIL
jgi:ATP-dependent RNA helicase SUPV3L1/SUV3